MLVGHKVEQWIHKNGESSLCPDLSEIISRFSISRTSKQTVKSPWHHKAEAAAVLDLLAIGKNQWLHFLETL